MKKFKNNRKSGPQPIMVEVIKYFETQANLARLLGVTRQYVGDWVSGRQEIPPIYAMRIEYLTQSHFRTSQLISECKQQYLKS